MKRANEAGVSRSRCIMQPVELLGGDCGCVLRDGGRSVLGLFSLTALLCLCVVVSLQRVGERGVYREGGAWYAIMFRCPGAEVGHLTSFRAEGAPGVAFPGAGLAAEGAGHARYDTILNLRIGQGSAWADLVRGGDLQQSVQAALIDLREAKEFDSKLPTCTPTDCGGFDCDGRTQIGRSDKDSHR
jgi:hypothetical protein